MLAYHNDPELKAVVVAQIQGHYDHDEIVHGQYWENGKGCLVGCGLHGSNHSKFETWIGIPEMLPRLADAIFEGLPSARSKEFVREFYGAPRVGADLSRLGWKWLEWLMLVELDYVRDENVRACLAGSASVLAPLTRGEPIDVGAATEAAARAATWAARTAARAATEAEARAAGAEAEAASYNRMADKLISLMAEA